MSSRPLERNSCGAVLMVSIGTDVVVDMDPISCLAVSKASCQLSSLVIAIVLMAVVGIGLTTLLKVDILP